MTTIIETERLVLRTWNKEDAEEYFQINQDQKVNELRGALTIHQANEFMFTANNKQNKYRFSLFAAEIKVTKEMIAFIWLKYINWEPNLAAVVSIGWQDHLVLTHFWRAARSSKSGGG